MKTYITICKNTILSNLKRGTNTPVIRVSNGKHGKPKRVHKFTGEGRATVVYDPQHPMPWGARAWVEIES